MVGVELDFFYFFIFILDVFTFSLLCGSCFYILFVWIDPEPCIYVLVIFICFELCGIISYGLSVMCFYLYVCYKIQTQNQTNKT